MYTYYVAIAIGDFALCPWMVIQFPITKHSIIAMINDNLLSVHPSVNIDQT